MNGAWQLPSAVDRLNLQVFSKTKNKILGPPRRSNHPVGKSLLQFSFSRTCLLRTCEVLFQSGGTSYSNGTADADQFPCPGIKNLFVLKIQDLLANLHGSSLQIERNFSPQQPLAAVTTDSALVIIYYTAFSIGTVKSHDNTPLYVIYINYAASRKR